MVNFNILEALYKEVSREDAKNFSTLGYLINVAKVSLCDNIHFCFPMVSGLSQYCPTCFRGEV